MPPAAYLWRQRNRPEMPAGSTSPVDNRAAGPIPQYQVYPMYSGNECSAQLGNRNNRNDGQIK